MQLAANVNDDGSSFAVATNKGGEKDIQDTKDKQENERKMRVV
jgi:hypothetical protein